MLLLILITSALLSPVSKIIENRINKCQEISNIYSYLSAFSIVSLVTAVLFLIDKYGWKYKIFKWFRDCLAEFSVHICRAKVGGFFGIEKDVATKTKEDIYKIVIAASELSKTKTGALIVIERDIEIRRENETRYLTEMGKMMDRIEQLERELVLAKMKEFVRGH